VRCKVSLCGQPALCTCSFTHLRHVAALLTLSNNARDSTISVTRDNCGAECQLVSEVPTLGHAVRAFAQAVRRRPLSMEARFRFQVSLSERFLMDEVALGQVSLPVSIHHCSTLIHPVTHLSTTEAILFWHLSASFNP